MNNIPAAYQGPGWRSRVGSLADDIREGRYWSDYSSDSEYGELKSVLLYAPPPETIGMEDVNSIQHLQPIDYKVLKGQIFALADRYRRLGITVHFIDGPLSDEMSLPLYNLMYVRDTFMMAMEGAIIARMASTVRAGEEKFVGQKLSELGIPISRTIGGAGTFEGADAIWLRKDLVLVGIGTRTNENGFHQLRHCFEVQGVSCIEVHMPSRIQHLLGIIQVVDVDLAIIRGDFVPPETKALMRQRGMELIELSESPEIVSRQAMNFVTVAPRSIVMAAGCPIVKKTLQESKIKIIAEVDISELIKGAGGIGCATGILARMPT